MSTAQTVLALKANDEDYEFYPTTDEIIRQVIRNIEGLMCSRRHKKINSIMDIGAGDGRVLKAIQAALAVGHTFVECYAIEKAMFHLSNMPKDITVVGTDFEQQTLVDKKVDLIFCNPPYSEFEHWALRIIREASAGFIYLVIPRRWRDSVDIKRALDSRSAEVASLGEFDFEDADRRAQNN